MSDSPAVHRESFGIIAGDTLGSGIGRTVYACAINPEWVVKVEETGRSFQNIVEWETWERVKHTAFARWFAPCLHISPCGLVLIMARTRPPSSWPARMPAFLADFKHANYGLYKGRLVCHDYGTNLLFERGMTKAMRRADWWD